MIFEKDPAAFRALDTCSPSIESMIGKDWERLRWNPSSGQRAALIRLISSNVGRSAQDELFASLMETFVADCERTYTSDVPAVMMYCEIRHLGGKAAADRIFKRCNGKYSTDDILNALRMDDPGSNQVGASVFMSRHLKCIEFIGRYAVEENGEDGKDSGESNGGNNSIISGNGKGREGSGSGKDSDGNGSGKDSDGSGNSKSREGGKEDTMATALSRAKTLLRQPQGDVMTGYTPDGKQCFVDAGAWVKKPKMGDVIYFYSAAKGRVGHVGIVERVDAGRQLVYPVEGNTSSSEYAENGGCVARHCYSYAEMGGTNRVNGFGRPDFEGAGVTAEQFVKMAVSFLGYLEKRSNKDLDSKTANAGSNNYQRFQRDVGAGNGDQWCQYFVDAVALYACQGAVANQDAPPETTLNESVEWFGYISTDLLNVRKWAGTENDLCSFSPLSFLTKVGVCDELKAKNGDTWYYIRYKDKHGFVSGKYVGRRKPATPSVSAEQFLTAVKGVAEKARKNRWKYGDSRSNIPCADRKISCDRLVARAMYNLGYHDQRPGGETCGTLDVYLTAHGWQKVTKASQLKPGAVVAVRDRNRTGISHVFVVVSCYGGYCVKYDMGSDERIKAVQPFKAVKLVEWSGRKFVCGWNVPETL